MDTFVAVTTTFGRINLTDQSLTLACFKVSHPFARVAASSAGRVRGRNFKDATSQPKTGGGFTETQSEFEEGTVILLQASRSRRGSLCSQGSMFLRLRQTAPVIIVHARLPHGPQSVLGDSLLAFTGHADILTYQELRVLGIEVNRKYAAAFMAEAEVAERFTVKEISPGAAARPVLVAVATQQGVEVKATAPEPERRIRFRGKT